MSAEGLAYPGTLHPDAEVAELVDALASGASGGIPVEVRVLFSAPALRCRHGLLVDYPDVSYTATSLNRLIPSLTGVLITRLGATQKPMAHQQKHT